MTSLRDPATTPVVVACCRTAIGRSHPDRGLFRHVRGDELATAVVQGVVERSGVDPATIEDVILGATQQQGELGGDVARCAALMAGLPLATAGATVNRLCGSSLEAIARAAHAVAAGNPAVVREARRSRDLSYNPVRFLAFQDAWLGKAVSGRMAADPSDAPST